MRTLTHAQLAKGRNYLQNTPIYLPSYVFSHLLPIYQATAYLKGGSFSTNCGAASVGENKRVIRYYQMS